MRDLDLSEPEVHQGGVERGQSTGARRASPAARRLTMEERSREDLITWLEDQFDQDFDLRRQIKAKYASTDDAISAMYDPSIVHTE